MQLVTPDGMTDARDGMVLRAAHDTEGWSGTIQCTALLCKWFGRKLTARGSWERREGPYCWRHDLRLDGTVVRRRTV